MPLCDKTYKIVCTLIKDLVQPRHLHLFLFAYSIRFFFLMTSLYYKSREVINFSKIVLDIHPKDF